MTKIVINQCWGGFSVSRKALHRMRELGSQVAKDETDLGERWPDSKEINENDWDSYCRYMPRDDPDLVEVVKTLGDDANGACARLVIVDVPDEVAWEIDDYDGMEHVAEKHRTWA